MSDPKTNPAIPSLSFNYTNTAAAYGSYFRDELHRRINILRANRDSIDDAIHSHMQALRVCGRISLAVAEGREPDDGLIQESAKDASIQYNMAVKGDDGLHRTLTGYATFPNCPSERIAIRDAEIPKKDLSESECFMIEAAYQYGGVAGGTDEHPTVTFSDADVASMLMLFAKKD